MKKHFWIALALIVIGIATRFIFLVDGVSVLPNFSAIGAIALFGGAYLRGAQRFIIPLGIYWVSDLVLINGFYSQYYDSFQIIGDYWVYGAFFIAGLVGYYLLRRQSMFRLFGASLIAAVIFYLITNFGVWVGGTMYPKDITGLGASYVAAIPFFWNTLLGNLFYGFVLFGAYQWLASKSFSWQTTTERT